MGDQTINETFTFHVRFMFGVVLFRKNFEKKNISKTSEMKPVFLCTEENISSLVFTRVTIIIE